MDRTSTKLLDHASRDRRFKVDRPVWTWLMCHFFFHAWPLQSKRFDGFHHLASNKSIKNAGSLLLFVVQFAMQVSAGTQFSSHVSVNTPARSFTHGVGDPISLQGSRKHYRQASNRRFEIPNHNRGYPREKPAIPFDNEDLGSRVDPWQNNNYIDISIPVLPASPYKVDSADPESLWPEGLSLPSYNPASFRVASNRRSEVLSEAEYLDPYLLEGSEAVAAVKRASDHGFLYFHDIPHIDSLFANQQLRIKNNLEPHRIASIRHTWPFNRE